MKETQAAGWKEIAIFGKVHNLIIHIYMSKAHLNEFKALVK